MAVPAEGYASLRWSLRDLLMGCDPVCKMFAHMTVNQLPSGRWRAQVRRKYAQLDATFDTEAEARAAEQGALTKAKGSKPDELTLEAAWEKYKASSNYADKADHTRNTERQRIVAVLEGLGRFTLLELEKRPELVVDWLETRKLRISKRTKKRVSSGSARLELAALASVVNFAIERRLIKTNFLALVKRPVTPDRKRRIEPEEQGQLAIYARNSDRMVGHAARFALLIRHLGCRPGELVKLKREDIRLDRHEVTFRDTKGPEQLREDRRVHTTKDARELIELQLQDVEDHDTLFSTWSRKQKAWVDYNYESGLKKLRKMGVVGKGYHAHAGRREFISKAIEENTPLTSIKKQTGHKSTQALEGYDQGLSTAPGIRAEFDRLAEIVRTENLLGALKALGLSEEQEKKLKERLTGTSEWTQPFKD